MLEDDFNDDVDDPESPELWQVYFLTLVDPTDPARDFGLVKVGITRGAVERRIEHLQTGNPYRIRCHASFPSPVARAVECWVHRTRHVEYLEWLRLRRPEIDALVEEAKRESGRLTQIAQARARWSQEESNGKERPPSRGETQLHDAMRGVLEDLWPARFQLAITLRRIALAAGTVRRVPGIIEIRRREAFRRFKPRLAQAAFPDLVAAYTVNKVQGRFLGKGLPGISTAPWTAMRAEAESLERDRQELNAAMLADSDAIEEECPRTDELTELHERFLARLQLRTRLEIDRQDLRAQAIQAMEDWQGVSGLWTYRRNLCPVFNGKAFREAHRTEAAASTDAIAPYIHRKVFLSRSY